MMVAAWLTLKEPWLILILSVVLGIIAGGNIKIIFTDSLFVCVGNDDMLINKKRSKSIAPFFIVCQLLIVILADTENKKSSEILEFQSFALIYYLLSRCVRDSNP